MPVRPLHLESARNRIRQIPDRVLREEVGWVVTAAMACWDSAERLPAADFDLLFLVEIVVASRTAASEAQPWRTAAQELFGRVPAEGFVEEEQGANEEQALEDLHVDLGPPEELEFPEAVLQPLDEPDGAEDDLALALALSETAGAFDGFDSGPTED